MAISEQRKNEIKLKGNSEDSLLVIYILQILKKYSSPKKPLSSQDVMHHLKEDYSIGIEGKTEALRKKVRRHLDTLCEFYWDPCIKKSEGKTRSGHKWFYDVSRDKSAKNNAVSRETLSKEELDFLIDMVTSSKIINSAGTTSLVKKLLEKTDLSNEQIDKRLKDLEKENFAKSINKELILTKKEIDFCIDEQFKIKFDYEGKKSILASPFGWSSDENGKYLLVAKALGAGEGEFEYFYLEKIENVKKMELDYCEEDDAYYDIPRSLPDRLSMESLFPNIRIINEAIKNNNSVEFKYLTYVIKDKKVVTDGKDKRIVPHGLVFTDGKYYLIGYDASAKLDYYRVDLISKLHIADKKIMLPYRDEQKLSDVQRAREIEKHPMMLAGTETMVVFKVVESALDRVIDAFAVNPDNFKVTEQTRVVEDSSAEEGIVEVKVTTTPEEAYRFALANADAVELMHPQDVRDRLGRIANPIHKTYAKTMADRVRENIDYIRKTGMFKITMSVDENTAFETFKELKKQDDLKIIDKIHIVKIDGESGEYFDNFVNARHLSIAFAPNCKNITWASKLTKIVSLDIHHTQMRDVSWLKVMKNLRYVEITETPICDLSMLKDHKHILSLNVSNTLITDISFIESYERLGKLDVSGCPIDDYTPLLKIRPLDMLIIDEKAIATIGMDNLVKHHPDALIKVQQKIDNRKF